ncbi:hypothetical protein M1769_16410 [Komagataeibacter oboediens]|nr:hypothetical protein [Komagataeibacter oboediens]MCK9821781.1 hypothetical protein [Komagataeibacter oboediens]
MTDVSRRDFVTAGVVFAGVTAAMGAGAWQAHAAGDGHGFMAASSGGPNGPGPHKLANPGLQGICAQTLTEQCIAGIWSLPEEQDRHECVIITPRYERTTMNDYWEHTSDVENTYRLVESLLGNTWRVLKTSWY